MRIENNPCTRCGKCCKEEICNMGKYVYKTEEAPCLGLKINKDNTSCELMGIMDNKQFFLISLDMGIGIGCTNGFK